MKPKHPMLIEIKENRLLQNPSLLIVGSFLLLILLQPDRGFHPLPERPFYSHLRHLRHRPYRL